MTRRFILQIALLILISFSALTGSRAQDPLSKEGRVGNLQERTRHKVTLPRVKAHWFDGGIRFWYWRDRGSKEKECILVDAVQGKRGPAFDHERLSVALAGELEAEVLPFQLPIDDFEFDRSGKSIVFQGPGLNRWRCELDSYQLQKLPKSEREKNQGLRFLDSPKPSRRGGEEIHVTFLNESSSPLDLFWIDNRGLQKRYGVLLPGKERVQHTFQKHVWQVRSQNSDKTSIFEAINDNEMIVISNLDLKVPIKRKKELPNIKSPDGKWEVRVEKNNLWAQRYENGQPVSEFRLTDDGTDNNKYVGSPHWSPDSTKLIFLKQKQAPERRFHIVESSPQDQVQPRLKSINYRKPGDQIPVSRPHLFDFSHSEPREIPVVDSLFSNPWKLSDFSWSPDSLSFSFLYNQRGHQLLRVVSIDASTGKSRTVIEETSFTFIDYTGKKFLHYSKSTNEFIWMSERDGWNHLYLYDGKSATVKNQITRGDWVVRGVDKVDEENRQIWFRAGGIYPGQDPYQVHYCRVNFDGSGLTKLTDGDGTHIIEYSPDRKYILATHSRVDSPPVIELREAASGKKLCELERADWKPLLGTGWQIPERFVAKGRDAKTDIYGVIYRPSNFDPKMKYPVIEKIYAGPHGSFVPKEFRSFHSAQELAEFGFLVVQIDGMGTSHRSKAFHDVAWKNLKDSGFPDRIRWMKAAARKYPEMDLSRVGIYGGSAGGQSTLAALLWYGDFYKAGVADCGCHDNRMDKIWWNELWMGWPVDKSYEENSNVVNAHRLSGKLLLTVGELDQNVDPASTMQVVDALIKADKDFDLIVVPGAGHGVGETKYMKRRRAQFFVRHLLSDE